MLWLAAAVTFFIGAMHSYLTETIILPRLLAVPNLPLLQKNRGFTERLHRLVWHLVTVYIWAAAALLAVLAYQPANLARAIGLTIAGTFVASAIFCLAVGPRHPAWPLFLVASAITAYTVW